MLTSEESSSPAEAHEPPDRLDDPRLVRRRHSGSDPKVRIRLLHPHAHGLDAVPQLLGESSELGRMIVLFVSGGENGSAFLPNLVGVTQDVAIARLNALGHPWELVGRAVTDPSQNLLVQAMRPEAGSLVPPGSTVIVLEIGIYEGGGD